MNEGERVYLESRGDIAWISLARPPVNAIDHAMIDALHVALKQADADPQFRAIVLTSAIEGIFCGGMDLRMVDAGDAEDLRAFVHKFYIGTMDIHYALSKPLIAALNGRARGAGMTLAINCDVAVAAEDIDFG